MFPWFFQIAINYCISHMGLIEILLYPLPLGKITISKWWYPIFSPIFGYVWTTSYNVTPPLPSCKLVNPMCPQQLVSKPHEF